MDILQREFWIKLLSKKFIAREFLVFIFICIASLSSMLFTQPIKSILINQRNRVYANIEYDLIKRFAKELSSDYSPDYALRMARQHNYINQIRNKKPYVRIIDNVQTWPLFVAKRTFLFLIIVFFVIRPLFFATKLSLEILKT